MPPRIENRVRVLRVLHRMTQVDLAEKLGVARSLVSMIENHQTDSMTYDLMAKLVRVFDLETMDELFEIIEDEKPGQKSAIRKFA